MRFSGHETFPVREGWLHKGLALLLDRPDRLIDEHAADWLGVGRNMARSIRHWLQVTGLAERVGGLRSGSLAVTDLGRLVYRSDPYFMEPGTWWALHVNIVNNPTEATSWAWFFNRFAIRRFDRAVCVEALRRHLRLHSKRVPSLNTLDRDLGCLLLTYGREIPSRPSDPEDAYDSPFRELGLLSHFRASGYYELDLGVKRIPDELLGYSLARANDAETASGKSLEVPIQLAAAQAGGPGRAFCLTAEMLFEQIVGAGNAGPDGEFELVGLAGERIIRVPARAPSGWLKKYYAGRGERSVDVA